MDLSEQRRRYIEDSLLEELVDKVGVEDDDEGDVNKVFRNHYKALLDKDGFPSFETMYKCLESFRDSPMLEDDETLKAADRKLDHVPEILEKEDMSPFTKQEPLCTYLERDGEPGWTYANLLEFGSRLPGYYKTREYQNSLSAFQRGTRSPIFAWKENGQEPQEWTRVNFATTHRPTVTNVVYEQWNADQGITLHSKSIPAEDHYISRRSEHPWVKTAAIIESAAQSAQQDWDDNHSNPPSEGQLPWPITVDKSACINGFDGDAVLTVLLSGRNKLPEDDKEDLPELTPPPKMQSELTDQSDF